MRRLSALLLLLALLPSCASILSDSDDPVTFDTKLDGWYFGNLIFGGLLGILIIDPATGAMWRLDETFTVYLDGEPPEEAANPAP